MLQECVDLDLEIPSDLKQAFVCMVRITFLLTWYKPIIDIILALSKFFYSITNLPLVWD